MQISDSSFLPFTQSKVMSPASSRAPMKPVTIEGQLLDDKKEKITQQNTESLARKPGNNFQTQLIQNINRQAQEDLTTSYSANDSPLPNATGQALDKQKFSYVNRRSLAGLAGSELVSQTYLSNESMTSSGKQKNSISLFV